MGLGLRFCFRNQKRGVFLGKAVREAVGDGDGDGDGATLCQKAIERGGGGPILLLLTSFYVKLHFHTSKLTLTYSSTLHYTTQHNTTHTPPYCCNFNHSLLSVLSSLFGLYAYVQVTPLDNIIIPTSASSSFSSF